jgi:peptidoglycan hydrolase-like protein with peptidoglycan-binding domain
MKYTKGVLAVIAVVAIVAGAWSHTKESQAQTVRPFIILANNQDLTVGSTGTGVIQLQAILSELGYLNIPVGVPLGYFGQMTKSAVAQYQTSVGVPSTGYFGPMTRQAMTNSLAARGWLSLLTL